MADSASGKHEGFPHPNPTTSFWHSEPSVLLLGHRSTRNLPEEVDVVVVGAGISGASVVHHLLEPYRQQDHVADEGTPSILLLDAREICWGATGRAAPTIPVLATAETGRQNGGHCQPLLFTHPNDPSIGHFELAGHRNLARLSGSQLPDDPAPPPRKTFPCEFVTQPGVQVVFDEPSARRLKSDLATLASHDRDLAAHCQIVTDKERLRQIGVPHATAALVTDVAARCWPYKFVCGVIEDLVLDEKLDGKFNVQTWTPVTSLHKDGETDKWLVKTDRGQIRAKHVILATNGYTSALIPEYKDVIVPCRGQMSSLLPPEELKGENRLKTSFGFSQKGAHDYLVQRPSEKGGHLMFGGAEQFGARLGVTDDSFVDERQTDWLRTALPRYFAFDHDKTLDLVQTWSGIMGFSRDEKPHVGPLLGHDGVFVCAGFNGHGMPNAWLCGKTAASMIARIRAGAELQSAIGKAAEETRIPSSYLLTRARLNRMREMMTVHQQDEREFAPYGGRQP